MPEPSTEMLLDGPHGQARAAAILKAGGLVAFPTETVYGLGADARDDRAVARIFEAKGRPEFNPLIVHFADIQTAANFAEFSGQALKLATAFWPGALTLVLPLKAPSALSYLVTAGLDTVAVRVPSHPTARSLLRTYGGPIAAPSANPSGKISPTWAEHVIDGLLGRIDAILDGGSCPVGVESTIVGFANGPTLLRPGGIPAEDIDAVTGHPLALHQGSTLVAPGQLASHYAPSASVRLNAEQTQEGEVFLGFGSLDAELNLSPSGDLIEAAANLFHHLRALDATGKPIAVAPIPLHGLGLAINDRLRRAAAPRDT